jgi:hypothetical protein
MAPAPDAAATQTPPAGEINIDHVAHFVPDIEAAGAALERLGFTLTPFSLQSHRLEAGGPLVPAGTGNRCVMLERGYIEFLTTTADTPLAAQLRAQMARYVGVHLLAFGTSAPLVDHARLAQAGFEPVAPVALQRPIETVAGEETARFTVVRVPPGKMAEGRIQFCAHHTPELLWQKRWTAHANGASALAGVTVCVDDAAEAARRYSRFTGLSASEASGAWLIRTARGTLTFVEPDTLAGAMHSAPPTLPWIAAYALETRDLAAAREHAAAAGYAVESLGGERIMVALPEALGGAVVFEPPGAAPLVFDRY